MDLGGALGYWVQEDDDEFFRQFRRQPSNAPGMWTRDQVVDYYGERTGRSVTPDAVALLRGLRAVPARGDRPADLVPLLPPADHQRGVRRVRPGRRLPRAALPRRDRPLMGQIVVVRHGQASFGADDYDVLSETGEEQARVVGRSLAHPASPTWWCTARWSGSGAPPSWRPRPAGWAAPLREDPRWNELDQLAQFATDRRRARRVRTRPASSGGTRRRWPGGAAASTTTTTPRPTPRFHDRAAAALADVAEAGTVVVASSGGTDLRAGDPAAGRRAGDVRPAAADHRQHRHHPGDLRPPRTHPARPSTSTSTCPRSWSPTAEQRSGSGRNPALAWVADRRAREPR